MRSPVGLAPYVTLAALAAFLTLTAALFLLRPYSSWVHTQSLVPSRVMSTAKASQQASTLCPNGVPSVFDSLAAANLVRDNMDPDFAIWEDRPFTLPNVKATRALPEFEDRSDLIFLIQIANNSMYFLDRSDDCADGCNRFLHSIRNAFHRGWASGRLNLPDTTFLLNVHDGAKCPLDPEDAPRCTAPMLSINRRVDTFSDILVPNFDLPFEVHSVPWDLKKPRAFFR